MLAYMVPGSHISFDMIELLEAFQKYDDKKFKEYMYYSLLGKLANIVDSDYGIGYPKWLLDNWILGEDE